jgi:hypothetical protein
MPKRDGGSDDGGEKAIQGRQEDVKETWRLQIPNAPLKSWKAIWQYSSKKTQKPTGGCTNNEKASNSSSIGGGNDRPRVRGDESFYGCPRFPLGI